MTNSKDEQSAFLRREITKTAMTSLGIGLVIGVLIGGLVVQSYVNGRTTGWTVFGQICLISFLSSLGAFLVTILLAVTTRNVVPRP